MKKRKIIIIRGLTTAGKSTTSFELAKVLPDYIFIDVWKIKEMFEPLRYNKDKRRLHVGIAKKAMLIIIREVIRKMGSNILLQESSISFLKKNLREDLKKHNYQIYSFFLDLDEKDVGKRDIQREKPTMGLEKQVKEGTYRGLRLARVEKGDIMINTSKKSIRKVVDFILKEVGEKRKKHPRVNALRKSW